MSRFAYCRIAVILIVCATVPKLAFALTNWRVATNALPWAVAVTNVSVERTIENKYSVGLSVYWCPWRLSGNFAIKGVAFMPEFKYWFNDNTRGHNVAVHVGAAWYNVAINKNRYQDVSRPLLDVGVSYGFLLWIAPNVGVEFGVGAGYVTTRYDRFYNISNGAVIDRRTTRYFGIDKLSVAFTYQF